MCGGPQYTGTLYKNYFDLTKISTFTSKQIFCGFDFAHFKQFSLQLIRTGAGDGAILIYHLWPEPHTFKNAASHNW
jgi:hypothetical protein